MPQRAWQFNETFSLRQSKCRSVPLGPSYKGLKYGREIGRVMEQNERPAKRQITAGVVILIAVVIVGIVALQARQEHMETLERTEELAVQVIGNTEESFEQIEPLTDSAKSALRTYRNEQHLEAAERYGISGIDSRAEAAELSADRELVRIETNPLYRVRELDYSVPYLTPDAANLLDRTAHRFHQRLAELGLPPYRLVVTSVTRSREDQEALRQVNVNAAQKSSHEYGTTFDLHYQEFDFAAEPAIPEIEDVYEGELRETVSDAYSQLANVHTEALASVLGDVLLDLQSENDAMVIYERRQPVYHVTVSNQIPVAPPRLKSIPTSAPDLVSMSKR